MSEQPAGEGLKTALGRRFRKVADQVFGFVVGPFAMKAVGADWARAFGYLPSLPAWLKRGTNPHLGAWSPWSRPTPDRLRSYAGIRRDPVAERKAQASGPVRSWEINFSPELEWIYRSNWRAFFFALPRLQRPARPGIGPRRSATDRKPIVDADALTHEVKEFAGQVGLSAVGVTEYDRKYILEEFQSAREGDRVIVCVLEENYGATQTIPSARYDRASVSCSIELGRRATRLAEMLEARGFRAHAHASDESEALVIAYAVQAGLGQLGLNGQLLTPVSGSRCRIKLVSTDAPLTLDNPVDYGIPNICDRCRACVRRCPAKALTAKRRMHRGVEKAKINPARCVPVLVAAHDCAICTKVCPIQRYGLAAVMDEFERTGKILGRQTDELEGYDWPLDGRHYGPGQKPALPKEFFEQPELARLIAFQRKTEAERSGGDVASDEPMEC